MLTILLLQYHVSFHNLQVKYSRYQNTNTQLKEAAHLCIELSDETVWYYEDDTYHLYVCAPCVLFILYTFGALNSIMAVCVYVL